MVGCCCSKPDCGEQRRHVQQAQACLQLAHRTALHTCVSWLQQPPVSGFAPFPLPNSPQSTPLTPTAHMSTSCADVLVNAFRSVLALAPGDLVAFAYLATGRVAPDYEGVELNVVIGSF